MHRFLSRRPSPAMTVALAALFVALSGGAYAAMSTLPQNSVGTAQLQNGAVTGAKLRANAVTASKVAAGSLLAKDFKSGTLPPVTVYKAAHHEAPDDNSPVTLLTIPGVGVVQYQNFPPAAGCAMSFVNQSGAAMPEGGIARTGTSVTAGDNESLGNGSTQSLVFVQVANQTGSGTWQFQTPTGLVNLVFFTNSPTSGCDYRAQAYLTGP